MSPAVKKIPDSVKKHLNQGEEFKELKTQGVFAKTYNVVTNKPHIVIKHELNNREIAEVFPRTISKAANISFAKPALHSTNGSDTFIEFYIKENLQFPEKCSKCGNEGVDLVHRTLKLEKTTLFERIPHIGLDSVDYRIPYCSNCYIEKAVKKNTFDGVRAILQFTNNNYANDFIRLNTE